MEAGGHRAELLDLRNGERLPGYDYVAVLAEQCSLFGGRMPEALAQVLASGRALAGRKGAAFLRKTGPFTSRGLVNLMKAMEREGMVINWSEVILSMAHAEALGRSAPPMMKSKTETDG
jgi:hypothetical protein